MCTKRDPLSSVAYYRSAVIRASAFLSLRSSKSILSLNRNDLCGENTKFINALLINLNKFSRYSILSSTGNVDCEGDWDCEKLLANSLMTVSIELQIYF